MRYHQATEGAEPSVTVSAIVSAKMITVDPPRTSPSFALSRPALVRFLDRVRTLAGTEGDIDVLLADDTTLRRLNRTYRGKNKATDVLSFPAAELADAGNQAMLGDLAISLDTAARQAAEHGLSLRDEVRILLLHGTLHLAGYDHETDSGEMAAREAELRKRLRLPSGLIARAKEGTTARTRMAARKTGAKAARQKSSAKSGPTAQGTR